MPGGWFGGATEAWAPTDAQKQAEEDEARELDELHALLGRGEGALSRGVFLKLQVAQENRANADEARAERQEVMRQIEMRAREQLCAFERKGVLHNHAYMQPGRGAGSGWVGRVAVVFVGTKTCCSDDCLIPPRGTGGDAHTRRPMTWRLSL